MGKPRRRRAGLPSTVLVALALTLALASFTLGGCGGGNARSRPPAGSAAAAGDCPTPPVDVLVTVDQWADQVERLGGACARVTTIIQGSSGDPHDYEPTPADVSAFDDARVVVLNGLGYDSWAGRVAANLRPRPRLVDAGKVVGLRDGDNPHLWYGPDAVHAVAAAVTDALKQEAPGAAGYLDDRVRGVEGELAPYDAEVAVLRAASLGRTYAATESVFDHLAGAVGLEDVTPAGYRNAAADGSEPAPGDIEAFRRALDDGKVDVLIFNTQTQGAVPDLLRRAAEAAGVPVVEVTETVAPGADGFVDWQLGQLRALAAALA